MKVRLIGKNYNQNYVRNLLRARGIKDIDRFLNPDESCLQSWEDLDNINKGVKLIANLAPEARVGLVVDCDIDGFTSASIIYQYLKRYLPNIKIEYYIHDGKAHGLEEHWEEIKDENFGLVIIPDAGRITA